MKTRQQIVFPTWRSPAAKFVDTSRRTRTSTALALGLTLSLHGALFQAVMLGSHPRHYKLPDMQGAGAAEVKSESLPSDTLVLLDLPTVEDRARELMDDVASAGLAKRIPLITILSDDPLPHVEIAASAIDAAAQEIAADAGDAAARVALFGRYTGQIDARIERAWKRPRSPVAAVGEQTRANPSSSLVPTAIDESTFRCRAAIIQDEHGVIQEVQLLDCNGSAVWRQSLVTAIFSASPLPAPPSPTVFTRTLTIAFEAHEYSAGLPIEEYEPQGVQTARMTLTH